MRSPAIFVGAGAGLLLLAGLAAVPGLSLIALGSMLAFEGRIARGERLGEAWPWLEVAPRVVGLFLGAWLFVLPVRLLSSVLADAAVIDPDSPGTRLLSVVRTIVAIAVGLHLGFAVLRGFEPAHLFSPLENVRAVFARRSPRPPPVLDLGKHLWLGVRGFAGAFVWLVGPTVLLGAGEGDRRAVATWLGGLALVPVLAWLPFLQARLAAEDRFSAVFEVGRIRAIAAAAPGARWLALVGLYALTVPLYLGTIVIAPKDAVWLITPIFVAALLPARYLVGWAYRRGANKGPAPGWLRFGSGLALAPVLVAYVFWLFTTQFIGARGAAVLFEHLAFLLPLPR